MAEIGKYDPVKIAAGLPTNLPVLALCGEKDSRAKCDEVKQLAQSFEKAGNKNVTFHQIANMDNAFKENPGPSREPEEWGDPTLRFSSEGIDKLLNFVKTRV